MVHVLFDHVNEAIICDGNQIFLLARRFKNPGIPTDYQNDSVSTPTSPSFLNRSDLTLLFAINPKNYSREKICRNCRLSLPNYVLGPGIYKPDPAGEYTKRNLGETVYSFYESFLDYNFWSRRLIAKSRVKSLRLRNEGEPGVDTESFW